MPWSRRTRFLAVILAALSYFQALCQEREIVAVPQPGAHSTKTPGYYALVIGIAHYQNLPQLHTPISDAQEIAAVLRGQYRFETNLLVDATRRQILDALDHYREILQEDDNLLVYYGGHGFFDNPAGLAYWAPVDAESDSHDDWIIANEVTGVVRAIAARHVLIVSDSCYSGMITRDASIRGFRPNFSAATGRDAFIAKLLRGKSRYVMSSGGNEPVSDGDPSAPSSNHSVFANALLWGLRESNMNAFSAEELFIRVQTRVGERSDQVPGYNPIRNSLTGTDQDGEFVFFRSGNVPAGGQDAANDTHQVPGADQNNTTTNNGVNTDNTGKSVTTDTGGKTTPAKTSDDRESILRTFRTLFVQTHDTHFFGDNQLTAALSDNKDFAGLNVQIVDDPKEADVVLDVTYTFPWDYPFELKHHASSLVLLAGKGEGPLSGPAGAKSVAKELIKLAKPYRSAPTQPNQ